MRHVLILVIALSFKTLFAQTLQAGFNKAEYKDLLHLTAYHFDSAYQAKIGSPVNFVKKYSSAIVGMDNKWTMAWNETEKIAMIELRGTTVKPISWIENFYAAMVPAKGSLKLNDTTIFNYKLAESDLAAVHIGWLTGMAFIANDLMPHLDSCINAGTTQFIVAGHSQGGALAFLLTSHLRYLQMQNRIPANVKIKTYCSAAPKPGNLQYAYDYEFITRGGWSFTVVNGADWVPEMPISIQTIEDFNLTNPFVNAKETLSKQKFPNNLALTHVYNQLNSPTVKARDNYQKYLGKEVSKIVKKHLPGYLPPNYYNSNNYMRCGQFIVLMPTEEYHKKFPKQKEELFLHHLLEPYLHLLNFQY